MLPFYMFHDQIMMICIVPPAPSPPPFPPLTFCTIGPELLPTCLNMNSDLDDINTLNSQKDVSSCQYYTFQEFLTSFPIIINDNSVNGTSDTSNNINSTMHTNEDSIKYKIGIKDNFSFSYYIILSEHQQKC